MIRDGRYKGTDFVNGFLESKFLENLLGKYTLLPMFLEYLNGAVSYIPKCYRSEYRQKMFDEIERLMSLTKDDEDLSILKNHLLFNGSSLRSIDRLKALLNDTHPKLCLKFSNGQKWRIVYKINSSSKYSKQQKQIYVDYMSFNDQSDTGKNWKFAIEGLTQDESKL